MGYSYSPVLNKNNRKNKTGKHSIFIRVTVDRESKYFNLKEKIDEQHWSGKDNKWVRDSHPVAFELNTIIRKKLEILQKYEYRQKLFGNGISLKGIIDFFDKKSDATIFNEFVAEYMKKSVRGKSLNTLKKYRTFTKYINEFNSKISFSQLSENLFLDFAYWLTEKGLQGITIDKYFDAFKVIVKQGVKEGYIEKDPFLYVKLELNTAKGKRVYLEIDEIAKLKNKKLSKDRSDLESVRMYWLFCFYAGFYYSDLCKLTWPNLQLTPAGYCIVGSRFKNESEYIVPIHKFPNAVEIIEAQKGKHPDLVFPHTISEQKYNSKLKDLVHAVGIKKKLMNKTARHSNIQFWEAQGLETQHTAKMVGHAKESTTKAYYDLSARDINNRVARFDFSHYDI